MSNKTREVVPKKFLMKCNKALQEALTQSNEDLRAANDNLASIEEGYIKYKKEVKSITSENLFKGLYAAFLLWKGERR